jgi:hypothetical protein
VIVRDCRRVFTFPASKLSFETYLLFLASEQQANNPKQPKITVIIHRLCHKHPVEAVDYEKMPYNSTQQLLETPHVMRILLSFCIENLLNAKHVMLAVCLTFFLGFVVAQDRITPRLMVPVGYSADLYHASFSKDGTLLLSLTYDGVFKNQILVWDLESGDILININVNHGRCSGEWSCFYFGDVFFSPSCNNIIAATGNNIQFWNIKTGEKILDEEITGYVVSDEKDKIIIFADTDKAINRKILDTETCRVIKEIPKQNMSGIKFCNDGQSIFFYDESSLYLWNYKDNRIVVNNLAHSSDIERSFVGSSKESIITFSEKELCFWSVPELVLLNRYIQDDRYLYTYPHLINDNKELMICRSNIESGEYEIAKYDSNNGNRTKSEIGILSDEMLNYQVVKNLYESESDFLSKLIDFSNSRYGKTSVYFSNDKSKVVIPENDSLAVILDVKSGEYLYSINADIAQYDNYLIDNDDPVHFPYKATTRK